MKRFTLRKSLLYILGLTLLGITVTFIQKTNLGMSSWDALNRNFYEGIPLEYKYLTPIFALIIISAAYLIQKKRPDLWMLFPIVISFYIGFVIDLLLLVVPSVENLGIFWNLSYLFFAIVVCAIGLNLLLYTKYPLPALDEFCYGLAKVFNVSFGKAKIIGEIIALILTVVSGWAFGHQAQWFYIGPTTFIFTFAIGFFIDVLRRPILFILEGRRANRNLQG
ncbi:MAG: hypothetical protein JXB20_02220 [Bacilli bacterium]|nr:hypothetical protein [Bacilli bacterium]MBN2696787.1 hypothetical protein [Bacilli bacterium]